MSDNYRTASREQVGQVKLNRKVLQRFAIMTMIDEELIKIRELVGSPALYVVALLLLFIKRSAQVFQLF